MGEDATGRPSGRRVTVDEAARILGLSVDAIRKRVQRDTIPHEKDTAGRVRIILDSPDNVSTLRDERPDTTGREELFEELRDRIRSLERRLDEERDARTEERRRYDTVIAQLSQASAEQARTIRELEAPRREQARSGPSGVRMAPEASAGGLGDAWDTWQEEPKEPSDHSEPAESPLSPGHSATPQEAAEEGHGAAETAAEGLGIAQPWSDNEGGAGDQKGGASGAVHDRAGAPGNVRSGRRRYIRVVLVSVGIAILWGVALVAGLYVLDT